MIEFVTAHPWQALMFALLSFVVGCLVIVGVILLSVKDLDDLDEKYRQKREARQRAYDELYGNPNRWSNVKKSEPK